MAKALGLPISERTMVKRILGYANAAFLEDSDFNAGMNWYADAQNLAERFANEYGVTLEIAASVIAATSPRTIWSFNVKHAEHILAGNDTVPSGALGTNDTRGHRALVEGFAGLGNGPKVNAFARNIAGDMHEVTIDMWAFAAACGDLGAKYLARKGAYQTVVSAYRKAADTFGITPAQMQAVVWVAIRGRAD